MNRKLLALAAVLAALPALASAQVTPRAGTTTVLPSASAVVLLSGPVTGCYVTNPVTAADQSIAVAEVMYLNPVTTATRTGNGTTVTLQPGQSWFCPASMSASVSAIAPTAGHRVTVVRW